MRTRGRLGLAPIICALAVASSWLVPATAGGAERALELVTPAEPVSASVRVPVAIAADGGRIAYLSLGPMPGAAAGDLLATNLAVRGAAGWTTTPVGVPHSVDRIDGSLPVERRALSADLLTTIWTATVPLAPGSPPQGRIGLYRRAPDGAVQLLAEIGESESAFLAASDDAARVVFASSAHLLPSDAGRTEGESIYEVSPAGLRQVDLDGSGAPLSSCGSAVHRQSAVSAGGERVFFQHPAPFAGCGPSRVYLREGATSTVEVSASRCGRLDCNDAGDVHFLGATRDGTIAFLGTTRQLTDGDLDERFDLYRYDVTTADLVLVTDDAAAGGEPTGGEVLLSTSGERAYFRSIGSLAAGDGGTEGENLYLASAAGLRFVAPLEGGDPVQISADGQVALLETALPLTPGDGDDLRDVYRYDAAARALEPLSFGPGFGGGPFAARIGSPSGIFNEPASRSLSDDGRVAAFTTAEPLVPTDHDGAVDVYERTATGPRMVDGGHAASDATLAGVSGDGGTIVLRTGATLLGGDRDGGEIDLYAARIGGGFPEAGEPGCGACGEAPGDEAAAGPGPPATARVGRERPWRPRARPNGRRLGHALAREGRAILTVRVSAPGPISARLRAAGGGREWLLARGRAGAVRPGVVRVVLVATDRGRRRLRRPAALPSRLELRQRERRLSLPLTLHGAAG